MSEGNGDKNLLLAAGVVELRQVLDILETNHDGHCRRRRGERPPAVDLQIFCETRLEKDLHCLVCRGYVKHHLPRRRHRISTPPVSMCADGEFPPRSRFSITPSGSVLARRLDQFLAELGCAAAAVASSEILAAAQPRFDGGQRALYFGATVLRRFKRSARSQIAILAAFEREKWPQRIADPLPRRESAHPGERLRATVHGLNGGQRPRAIRFFCDGTGDGICWDFIVFSSTETCMILDALSRSP